MRLGGAISFNAESTDFFPNKFNCFPQAYHQASLTSSKEMCKSSVKSFLQTRTKHIYNKVIKMEDKTAIFNTQKMK